jgi:hypothetical protein
VRTYHVGVTQTGKDTVRHLGKNRDPTATETEGYGRWPVRNQHAESPRYVDDLAYLRY